MPVKLPKIGKRYKYTNPQDIPSGMTFLGKDNSFVVSSMSKGSGAYTHDVLWCNKDVGELCAVPLIDRPLIELVRS